MARKKKKKKRKKNEVAEVCKQWIFPVWQLTDVNVIVFMLERNCLTLIVYRMLLLRLVSSRLQATD